MSGQENFMAMDFFRSFLQFYDMARICSDAWNAARHMPGSFQQGQGNFGNNQNWGVNQDRQGQVDRFGESSRGRQEFRSREEGRARTRSRSSHRNQVPNSARRSEPRPGTSSRRSPIRAPTRSPPRQARSPPRHASPQASRQGDNPDTSGIQNAPLGKNHQRNRRYKEKQKEKNRKLKELEEKEKMWEDGEEDKISEDENDREVNDINTPNPPPSHKDREDCTAGAREVSVSQIG